MKNNFFTIIAFFGLAAFALSSCSKVPQAEIDAANTAIEQSKLAGAEVYVHESFVALQDSMNSVMVNVESQKSKFFKNYGTAKEQLIGIVTLAENVKQQTEAKKEEMKAESQTLMTETQTLIESNKQLIAQAPKGKEGAAALLAIQGENEALENALTEAKTLFETGDYMATLDKVKATKEKATAINAELTEAFAKFKSKSRR
ncbi:MAG: hypothetical protein CVU09_13585 [Bacteroidetes bacterium HGW-Bacteroidetes-4]|jgi:hypothetical protein|nr:MAG: hypothetical protein CVU09_13585 [Bacteroidetes bacterium HGW-Bacteroidetes-4]